MAKKEVNKELVEFAVEARKQGLTYGQLQVREHFRKEKQKKRLAAVLPGDWWKGEGQ